MWRYLIAAVGSGLLFGALDGAVHANPLARRLYQAYGPILKGSVDPIAGVALDLGYGFAMAAVFLQLHRSLPGRSGLVKGLSFGALVWFFRVVMSAASTWMMFAVPVEVIFYDLVAGLGEMLVLGLFYGVVLKREQPG